MPSALPGPCWLDGEAGVDGGAGVEGGELLCGPTWPLGAYPTEAGWLEGMPCTELDAPGCEPEVEDWTSGAPTPLLPRWIWVVAGGPERAQPGCPPASAAMTTPDTRTTLGADFPVTSASILAFGDYACVLPR